MSDDIPGVPSDASDELAVLTDAALSGACDAAQSERLRQLLRADPAAMGAYLDQVRVHALLQWRNGSVQAPAAAGARSRAFPRLADASGASPASTASTESPLSGRTAGPLRATAGAILGSRPTSPLHATRRRAWAAAAAVLIAVGSVIVVTRRAGPPPGDRRSVPLASVAEVIDAADVVWADGQRPLSAGASLAPGDITLSAGTLRLRSSADAVVSVTGPARVRLLSRNRMRALAGRVLTRVGPAGAGFVVEAPGADVRDLGTEFGVQVGDAGQTDVVVFEGNVDLTPKPPPSGTAPASQPATTRIVKGEGLHVDPAGGVSRVVAVERRPGTADWAVDGGATATTAPAGAGAVIAAVRDNRRDPASPKFYQIARRGLAEDVPAYVDRPYEWNGVDARGLPAELRDADLVMTFNDDKRSADLALTVTLARPAALYVFHEPRHGEVPDWLCRDFVDTGLTIGLDEGPPDMPQLSLGKGPGVSVDRVFTVWRRDVREGGAVTLGANTPAAKSMYGIAAVPLP